MSKFEKFAHEHAKIRPRNKDMLETRMDSFVMKNVKQISLGSVEFLNNTLFHFLDTIKVRIQAKCIADDVSLYFRNQVTKKRKIFLI
jgi:hypothetical protein